jgi:hypothetical protein
MTALCGLETDIQIPTAVRVQLEARIAAMSLITSKSYTPAQP